jgi:hypothetical protein
LFFGGQGTNSDTWLWDGRTWAMASPPMSPPGRFGYGLAYDRARAQVLLFGGSDDGVDSFADTWTWNGTTWTQTTPAASPSPRWRHRLAYDAARARTVLFGGQRSGNPLADTWTWDGSNWTQLSPTTSPPARWGHGFVYDATRSLVVLFGGETGNVIYNDTWTWDGTTWAQLTPAATPPTRDAFGMTYDLRRGRAVLFGGYGGGGALNDTWLWDGTTWSQASPAVSPSPRDYLALGFDEARGRVVTFGGVYPSDTWIYYGRGGACTAATAATDCASGFCVDGVCCDAPACGTCEACDQAESQGVCSAVRGQSDPDSCSGARTCDATGACKPSLGQPCTSGTQCASGFCADGVCCDSTCTGLCMACTAALKASGSDGHCDLARAGSDAHNDCPDDGVASCGRDGTCDGTGRCRLYAQGTACGPSNCVQNRATGRICNGLGACVNDANGSECSPYLCNPTTGACGNPCASAADCVPGDYCSGGTCSPRLPLGSSCTSGAACEAGAFCVDGVCCNTPCTEQCASCTTPGAKGSCVPTLAARCTVDGGPVAAGAFCSDGICCNAPCSGQCESCTSATAPGSCLPTRGAPAAARPPCAMAPSNNVCAASSCDGFTTDHCAGFVGPEVPCRAASCTGGVAVVPAKCTSEGQCQDLVKITCAPYVCAGTQCGMSCVTDADCDTKFTCTPNHACVPKTGAACDGDHTLVAPDGTKTDCAPYKCEGTRCKSSCASISECAYPSDCAPDSHTCVAPLSNGPPSGSGGCACKTAAGERGGRDAEAIAAMAIVALAVRRRRAPCPRS